MHYVTDLQLVRTYEANSFVFGICTQQSFLTYAWNHHYKSALANTHRNTRVYVTIDMSTFPRKNKTYLFFIPTLEGGSVVSKGFRGHVDDLHM